jgi:inner membrane transporter RhtA
VRVAPPRTAAAGALLVVTGALCVQSAAAIAVGVFAHLSPAAVSGWRFGPGALVLVVLVRPRVRAWGPRQWGAAGALGVATALMNLAFFQAIARIHLGTAVAVEYLGPFLVAALARRTWRHGALVLLAAAGVVALVRPGGGASALGVGLAAVAALGWGTYTFAAHRVGAATEGFDGLAVAMVLAAGLTAGFAAPSLGTVAASPALLARLVAMSVLAVVLGFASELQALRRLTPGELSVLLALDPAIAFLVGWALLGQRVVGWDLLGLALVSVAGVVVTRDAARGDERAPR